MPFSQLPISEQIDANVLRTLQGIATTNGFQITLSPVMFPDPSGNTQPSDMMCVLYVGDDVEDSDDDTPLGMIQWKRSYAVQVYIIKTVPELQATRFETWKNVIRAEVDRALVADVYRKDTNNNPLAENTETGAPITFEDANDAQGIFMNITVTYRTNYLDPYSQTSSEE